MKELAAKARFEEEAKRQEQERAQKATKIGSRAGLKPLGAVEPRQPVDAPKPADAALTYPTPASAPGMKKLDINISSKALQSARREVAEEDEDEDDAPEGQPNIDQVKAEQPKAEQPLTQEQLRRIALERRREDKDKQKRAVEKKKSKKRRRRHGASSESDGARSSDNESDVGSKIRRKQEPVTEERRQAEVAYATFRVKGEVSRDNKGMTDADLERRFPGDKRSAVGVDSSLMSEKEALAMIRKERHDKGGNRGSHARAQREAAEWENVKAQRVAQTGFNKHKDRAVVSGRL